MNNKGISKKEIVIKVVMSTVLLTLLFLSFLFSSKIENALKLNSSLAKNQVTEKTLNSSNYYVSYLDVGQGNSALIKFPDGKTMLVDGGNTMYGETVYNELLKQNIQTLDFLIATHADSDHIGGLNFLFDKIEIKQIFRPFQISGTGTSVETFVPSEDEDLKYVYEYYSNLTNGRSKISRVTSSVYSDFISNIYSETYTVNNVETASEVIVFYDGLKISGEGYHIEFFAPLVRSENINISQMSSKTGGFATVGYGADDSNDNSAVFLINIQNDKFLFTGDASWKDSNSENLEFGKFEEADFVQSLTLSEKEMLKNVTVYLAGHHGSSYSSSELLFNLINPNFVVFSVGFNNFGHPSSEVIFRAEKTTNLEKDYLLRTDKAGTITFGRVDGKCCYALQITEENSAHLISWELLSSVICVCLIAVIIFIKPKRAQA